MEHISRTIGPEDVGRRLDQYVASLAPGVSRSEVQRQIREGLVVVSGRPGVAPSYRLRHGDAVDWEPRSLDVLVPRALSIPILYEDGDIVAVDKPANLIVHPGSGTRGTTTLVEALLATRSLAPSDDPARPGIVHRIDKETTGVLVVAKTASALVALKDQFARRAVEKQYLAWVAGAFDESDGTIDAPVGRDPRAPRRMAVSADGRLSQTEFSVLERHPRRTLLLVRPKTGRTHQIRVHFLYIGHPVIGDRLYGGPPAPRLFLHAWKLSIDHPATGARLTFEAPPPASFPRGDYGALSDRAAKR